MNPKCAAALITLGLLLFPTSSYAITDQELTQKIRAAIDADASISEVGNRVKINVENGKVTLKGSVESEDQRQAVEKHATAAAGPGNITDDVTIKVARAKKRK